MSSLLAASALLIGWGAVAPGAWADEAAELEAKFAAADTDGDGKLTREEAKAGGLTRIARGFDRIDADKTGYITLDQIKAKMQGR